MSATKKLDIDLPRGRHSSILNLNPDGVKLPPIPMSIELAVALEVEASRNLRSPRDHALIILEVHFRIAPAGMINLARDRYVDLHDTFANEPDTRSFLTAILGARAARDDQQAQLLALSYCLAEVMDNPFVPVELYNIIGDALSDMQNEHEESGAQERDLRAGFFVPVLAACERRD